MSRLNPIVDHHPTPFATRVIVWQRAHGRHHLPWQQTHDAYRIWLSEIMLQQTQVGTVIDYFERFVARFPNVQTLAAADEDTVLSLWSGLGYYARGRNLLRAAQCVVTRFEGKFPSTVETLCELPGVGRSTAGAIAALAYGTRAAILDGNVKRVLVRHQAVMLNPADRLFEPTLWQAAEACLPSQPSASDIAAYTQGMMDLGATICMRSRPDCLLCPVAADCLARQNGLTQTLPLKRIRKPLPQRHVVQWLIWCDDFLLLQRRPSTGVWGGLWALPETAADTIDALTASLPLDLFPSSCWPAAVTGSLPSRVHTFTHFQLQIAFRVLNLSAVEGVSANAGGVPSTPNPGYQWCQREAALALGLPAVLRAVLSQPD